MGNDNPYQPPSSQPDLAPVRRRRGFLVKSLGLCLGVSIALQLFGLLVAMIVEAFVPYPTAQKINFVAMLPLAITQWLFIKARIDDVGTMMLCFPIAWLWVGVVIWGGFLFSQNGKLRYRDK